jgi:Predicted RNA-binding protein containing KH domain, possibly ribosomal protein
MALTGAQVKQLRSMAHHLNPAIIIGKSDVNEGTVEQTVAYLEKHELVKCSVLDGSSLSGREAAEELVERCHAEVVPGHRPAGSRLYREVSRRDLEKIPLV